MRMKFLLILALALAACSSSINDSSLTSGIRVRVFVGPMCPVVQSGTECPDQPYQATLTVLDSSRRELKKFETDQNGIYSLKLPPGRYILRPEPPEGMPMPFASEQTFEVRSDQITELVVNYDSGIR